MPVNNSPGGRFAKGTILYTFCSKPSQCNGYYTHGVMGATGLVHLRGE